MTRNEALAIVAKARGAGRIAVLRGAYLSGADLRGAVLRGTKEKPEHVVSALKGRAYRSDGYEFLIFATETGECVRAGCRTFTLAEFRAHVAKEYPDTPKAHETLRLLDFLEATLTAEAWAWGCSAISRRGDERLLQRVRPEGRGVAALADRRGTDPSWRR